MNPTTYQRRTTHTTTTTTTTTPQPTAGKKKKKTKQNKKCWSAPTAQPPTNEPNHLPTPIYPHKKCWSTAMLTMKWKWMSLRDRSWESERPELREWDIGDRSWESERPKLREWAWERWASEMRRWDESEWERESDSMYYFNHRGIKIIFFLFSSHEQCPSIYRCAL